MTDASLPPSSDVPPGSSSGPLGDGTPGNGQHAPSARPPGSGGAPGSPASPASPRQPGSPEGPEGPGGSADGAPGPKPWLWIIVAIVVVVGIVLAVVVGGDDDTDPAATDGDGVEATDEDPDSAGGTDGEDGNDTGDGNDDANGNGNGNGTGGGGSNGGDGDGDGTPGGDGGDGNGGSSGDGNTGPDGDPESDPDGGAGADPGTGGNQTSGPPSGDGFSDGTYIVGEDIEPGLYRSDTVGNCYWARLSGLAGELDDIIANGLDSPEIVAILAEDAGFETQDCGQWLPVDSTVPDEPATSFGDGTHLVGEHIEPGLYTPDGDDEFCYWARLSDFEHIFDGVIANGMGPGPIEVLPDDLGVSAFGCGTYSR